MSEIFDSRVGIITYAFGADPYNPVNLSLAGIVARQYEAYDGQLTVAAQDEVAEGLQGLIEPADLLRIGTDHTEYLNTADIAIEALAGLYGRTKLLVVAQRLHAVRAVSWTRRLASEIGVADVSRVPDLPKDYAPSDPQKHVHSLQRFLPRELVAMSATPIILRHARSRLSSRLATA